MIFVPLTSYHFSNLPSHRNLFKNPRYILYKFESEEIALTILNLSLSKVYEKPKYFKGFKKEEGETKKCAFLEERVAEEYVERRWFSSKIHKKYKLEDMYDYGIFIKNFKEETILAIEVFDENSEPDLDHLEIAKSINQKLKKK